MLPADLIGPSAPAVAGNPGHGAAAAVGSAFQQGGNGVENCPGGGMAIPADGPKGFQGEVVELVAAVDGFLRVGVGSAADFHQGKGTVPQLPAGDSQKHMGQVVLGGAALFQSIQQGTVIPGKQRLNLLFHFFFRNQTCQISLNEIPDTAQRGKHLDAVCRQLKILVILRIAGKILPGHQRLELLWILLDKPGKPPEIVLLVGNQSGKCGQEFRAEVLIRDFQGEKVRAAAERGFSLAEQGHRGTQL